MSPGFNRFEEDLNAECRAKYLRCVWESYCFKELQHWPSVVIVFKILNTSLVLPPACSLTLFTPPTLGHQCSVQWWGPCSNETTLQITTTSSSILHWLWLFNWAKTKLDHSQVQNIKLDFGSYPENNASVSSEYIQI